MPTSNTRPKALRLARSFLPVLILAVCFVGFKAMGERESPPRKEADAAEALGPVVETIDVERHAGGLDIEVDGVAAPYRELQLAAEVGGTIHFKSPKCRAGRFVEQGDLLLEIDPRDYRLEVDRLTSEREQAVASLQELDVEVANTRASIELAEADVELQQRELNRVQSLVGQRVRTDSEVDTARRAELASRTTLQTLKNQLAVHQKKKDRLTHAKELAEVKLERAELDLNRTKVFAPVDGVIVSDAVEYGGRVQTGTLLATLEDTSAIEVRSMLRVEELDWMWRQQPSNDAAVAEKPGESYVVPQTPATVLYTLGGNEYAWRGRLSRFDGSGLDERTRTVPCRVLVPSPKDVARRVASGTSSKTARVPAGRQGPQALMRGMYVRVLFHVQPETQLLKLPERAVQPGNRVWRVRNGKLEIVTVQVARVTEDGVLIDADVTPLEAGDAVVVSPLASVQDGMAVRRNEE